MKWGLDKASIRRLAGVHPDLIKLVLEVAKVGMYPFMVFEGLRTAERQKILVREGKSKTMNSRHLTGHAVDLIPMTDGRIDWRWPSFYPLAAFIKEVAAQLNQQVEWGGDWVEFKDGPHWQLPWKLYPKE